MAHIIADRVKETTTTTGTGSLTLAGAVEGFVSFDSKMDTSDTCFYSIDGGAEWEVGLGTFTSPSTLTRTTVLSSSNSDTAVTFSSGTKSVFITQPASQLSYISSGTITPVLIGQTTAGVGTYTTQTGYYHKVGNIVFFNITFEISAHTGTGNMELTGLPFTSIAFNTVVNIFANNLTSTTDPIGLIPASSTVIRFYRQVSASTAVALPMDTGFQAHITGSYIAA